jgi:hypothetical protein
VKYVEDMKRSEFIWGFSLYKDHTLETVAQKITTPVVALIVISGKRRSIIDFV